MVLAEAAEMPLDDKDNLLKAPAVEVEPGTELVEERRLTRHFECKTFAFSLPEGRKPGHACRLLSTVKSPKIACQGNLNLLSV